MGEWVIGSHDLPRDKSWRSAQLRLVSFALHPLVRNARLAYSPRWTVS